MSFNIQEFKSAINRGLARSHSYKVTIYFWRLNIFGSRQLQFLCESAELPGRRFNTTPELMYGVARKMPFSTLYEDLSLTFMCTNGMEERYFFDRWMSYIIDPTSGYVHYHKDYIANIEINTFDPNGLTNYTLYVEEACPISVLPQPVSYADENNYLKLTVDFAYRRWRNNLEVAVGNAYPKGHTIDPHIHPEDNPDYTTQFPAGWQAPHELVTQQNYNHEPGSMFGVNINNQHSDFWHPDPPSETPSGTALPGPEIPLNDGTNMPPTVPTPNTDVPEFGDIEDD